MLTLVITPTYNEEENLPRLVTALLGVDPSLDLLVVDDGSPDGTGDLADALATVQPRVHVLHRAGKQGLGTAYLAGFRYALTHDYEAIVEMDADLSHNPADLARLLAPVAAGEADLVLGSRWTEGGGTRNWSVKRQCISRSGSWYARTVLQMPVRDLTGGFKCFHRRVLERLDLDSVRASGYGFQIELTYKAALAGFRVQEIPIIFTERIHGLSKMSQQIVFEAMVMVWRLRLEQFTAGHAKSALGRALG